MSNNENQIEENVNEKNKDEHFLPKGYVVKVTAKNKKFIEGPPEQLKKQRKSVKIFDKQQLSSLHSNGMCMMRLLLAHSLNLLCFCLCSCLLCSTLKMSLTEVYIPYPPKSADLSAIRFCL